jgi:hypothetical protein
MPTVSFNVRLGPEAEEFVQCDYFIKLDGDRCTPTRWETRIVMSKLALHALRIKDRPETASSAVSLDVEEHENDKLLSSHFTVHVARADEQAMAPSEVGIALLDYEFARLRGEKEFEHIVAMPLSALKELLNMGRAGQHALTEGIGGVWGALEEIYIEDESVAGELIARGLVIAGTDAHHYRLRDVDLQ